MIAKEKLKVQDFTKEKRIAGGCKSYRTKSQAGEVAVVPEFVPAITNQEYQGALRTIGNDHAYLQPMEDGPELHYAEGVLSIDGMSAVAVLKDLRNETVENIDLPLLRLLYGIFLKLNERNIRESNKIDLVVTVYVPELLRCMYGNNAGSNTIAHCMKAITSFQTIIGIINRGRNDNDILPVLLFMGYDSENNTIAFSSPYLVRVIKEIKKVSIRTDHKGKPLVSKMGKVNYLPSHSYLIKASIVAERNKRAAELVFIVVTLIEQCGGNKAHIKASTIVERIPDLAVAIKNCRKPANVNVLLKRVFSKGWELLRSHTTLEEHYKSIKLPDLNAADFAERWLPTSSTMNKVFCFCHEGKILPRCSTNSAKV